MAGKIRKLIVSDFHLGDGQPEGELNPWENFHNDDKFAELLRYYSTDYYEDEEVELIINGDFFDLLQVRYDGEFPVYITEQIAVAKLKAALDGHPVVTRALREFVHTPGKSITVLPGNHDFELIFPGCQRLLCEGFTGSAEDERFQVIVEQSYYEFDGVQVHHGMQFEAMNRTPWDRKLVRNADGEEVLYMPFGSIFILKVLNTLKEKRPYVDQVQPFTLYLLGALLFDTGIALKLLWLAWLTFWRYRIKPLWSDDPFFLPDVGGFFEYSAFPNFERKVRNLMRQHPHVHTVIMGHTHLRKVRRFGHNKTYINTGTWSRLISLDISNLGVNRDLTYAAVEYFDDEPPRASLRAWQGYRDLWREIQY